MAEIHMKRAPHGLVPATADAAEMLAKIGIGKPVNAKVTQPRNGKFHRKFFGMLDVAYSNHEWPEVSTNWGKATVSRDLFRQYVTVKAGYYEAALTPHGEVRCTPKSISWAKMDETEFERLYSAVLDVILAEFLTNWTTGDMDHAVNQMMGFA